MRASILLLLSVLSPAFSANCNSRSATLFFGNGILTNVSDAIAGLNELQQVVDIKLNSIAPNRNIKCVQYQLSYNKQFLTADGMVSTAVNFILQLIDGAVQRGLSDYSRAWSDLFPSNIAVSATLPVGWESLGEQYVALFQAVLLPFQGNLQQHVVSYNNELTVLNNDVIVVAHSQGNTYANAAFSLVEIPKAKSFTVVAVATPESTVAGAGPHVTLNNDIILLVPGALGANEKNTNTPDRCLSAVDLASRTRCHEFALSYLAGDSSRSSIVSHVAAKLLATGAIEATGWLGIAHDAMQTFNASVPGPTAPPTKSVVIDPTIISMRPVLVANDGSIIVLHLAASAIRSFNTAGAQKWSLPALGNAPGDAASSELALGASGTVYEARYPTIRALSGETGATLWTRTLPTRFDPTSRGARLLVARDETLVVQLYQTGVAGLLLALNRDGTTRWQTEAIIAPQLVVLGANEDVVYASVDSGNSGFGVSAVVGLSMSDGSRVIAAKVLNEGGDVLRRASWFAPWGRLYGEGGEGIFSCKPDLSDCQQVGGAFEGWSGVIVSRKLVRSWDASTKSMRVYDANGSLVGSFSANTALVSPWMDSNGFSISNDLTNVTSVDGVTGTIRWSVGIGGGRTQLIPHSDGCLYGMLQSLTSNQGFGKLCP